MLPVLLGVDRCVVDRFCVWPAVCVVDQPCVGSTWVEWSTSCVVVELCIGSRPVVLWSTCVMVDLCVQSTCVMVDLCVVNQFCLWSTWLERRTGRGLMGVQLPVLTSQPGINLLRGG